MTLDTVGGRHNLPEVILGDEREELETETEASFDPVRGRFRFFPDFFSFFTSLDESMLETQAHRCSK